MEGKPMTSDTNLPLISVIFVTYNRAHTLVATYETFLAFTDYPRDRLELILADDASDAYTQRILAQIPFDKRAVAARNSGLGANQNRGIRAASGDYILMMQDDWLMVGRRDYLRVALQALEENPDLGLILFRDRAELDVAEERRVAGHRLVLPALGTDDVATMGVHQGTYSDNPHLKRREFHDVIGLYQEGVPMTRMELAMSRAVAAQSRFKVASIDGFEVFRHIGDRFTFNPAERRWQLEQRIARWPGGTLALAIAKRVRRLLRGG
jgi:glycosyltransferase involved in cell wall biosynthesis